jgi:uncharacterized protein YneF (UPF0154 family)
MNDTTPDIEKKMVQIMAERTPTERLRMASSMFDAARKLMRAGLLHENPSLNEAQIRARIFMRMYGDCYSKEEIRKIMQHLPDMQWEGDDCI